MLRIFKDNFTSCQNEMRRIDLTELDSRFVRTWLWFQVTSLILDINSKSDGPRMRSANHRAASVMLKGVEIRGWRVVSRG